MHKYEVAKSNIPFFISNSYLTLWFCYLTELFSSNWEVTWVLFFLDDHFAPHGWQDEPTADMSGFWNWHIPTSGSGTRSFWLHQWGNNISQCSDWNITADKRLGCIVTVQVVFETESEETSLKVQVLGERSFSNWKLCSLILMLSQAQLPGDRKLCEVLNLSDLSSLSAGHMVHIVDTLFSLWFLYYLFLMLTSCGLKGNTVGWYGMTDPAKGFILSWFRWGLYWWMDLLTTWHVPLGTRSHYSPTSNFHKSLAHAMSSQSSLGISWQRLLRMEIVQLPALRSSCYSCPCRSLVNHKLSYSATPQPPLQSSTDCQPWTELVNLIVFRITPWCKPHQKHHSSIVAFVCFQGNVFTKPLHSNGCTHRLFLCLATCRPHVACHWILCSLQEHASIPQNIYQRFHLL
jgi:hypothetical protein